jgi:hypothetical protein
MGYNIGNTAADIHSVRNSSKGLNIGKTAVDFHSLRSSSKNTISGTLL